MKNPAFSLKSRGFGAVLWVSCLVGALFVPMLVRAASDPHLNLPEFAVLTKKATDSVIITLDSSLLTLAAQFLDGANPDDAATKSLIKGLRGIYIRSFTFATDAAYQLSDLDGVRSQLAAPGWSRLVQTRSKKTRADVDIYVMVENNQATGLAVIASEPRQFTIVNIVGAIDLQKLRSLEGQFGVPKLDIDWPKTAPVK